MNETGAVGNKRAVYGDNIRIQRPLPSSPALFNLQQPSSTIGYSR